ncbi:MAG TPA: HD domain-containing protein [Gaiellaceae bacterium]|jgi:hypothetical protein|nr:HD domain-containing protein [Gaiellaceae bacterium]
MPAPNPAIFEALTFAVEAHGADLQVRKGTRFPYVIHPIRVADTLQLFEADDEVVIAGLLHDTIEDAGITADEIESRFGARVALIVVGASEPDKGASWKDRKQHTIDYLRDEADHDTLMVAAADKLDNARSIRETLERFGEEKTWARFNEGRREQHWYYRGLAEVFLGREPNNLLFRTLDSEVQTLFPDPARGTRLFSGKPIGTAHDARAFLGDPIKHWKPEHSAYELPHAWVAADGLPAEIDAVLRSRFGPCELVEGIFEKETSLPGGNRASQTDLLALVRSPDGYVVVGVEARRENRSDSSSVTGTTAARRRRSGSRICVGGSGSTPITWPRSGTNSCTARSRRCSRPSATALPKQ